MFKFFAVMVPAAMSNACGGIGRNIPRAILISLLFAGQPAFCLSFGDVLTGLNKAVNGGSTTSSQPQPGTTPNQASPVAPQGQAAAPADSASIPTLSPDDQKLMTAGMWRDPQTGLVWMRCVLGDVISSGDNPSCEYSDANKGPFNGTWSDAVTSIKSLSFGGFTDWRLPSIKELMGIASWCVIKYDDTGTPLVTVVKIPTSSGDVMAPKGCSLGAGVKSSQPVPGAFGSFASGRTPFWSSTKASDSSSISVWAFGDNGAVALPQGPDGGYGEKYAYAIVVRGGSYDEFNALATDAEKLQQQQAVEDGIKQKQLDEEYAKERQHDEDLRSAQAQQFSESEKRIAAFQAHVKLGDSVWVFVDSINKLEKGLVIEVNGNIVLVQINDLAERLWFKRSQVSDGQ